MAKARECPKCGGNLFVIGTYKYPPPNAFSENVEYRRRRLECSDCGIRINTYEIDEEDFKYWYFQHRTAEKIISGVYDTLQKATKETEAWREKFEMNKQEG